MWETLAYTAGPPLVVAVLFGAWWLLMHRRRPVSTRAAAPAKLDRAAAARLAAERRLASVVEEFEKLVAAVRDSKQSVEIIARVTGLSDEAKSRLSAGCLHAIGTAFAEVNRSKEALLWIECSADRDEGYFRKLNVAIEQQITGAAQSATQVPKYPFSLVQLPGLATRTRLKAQQLHSLGRHAEVESLLGPFVESAELRYLRAELRRQRGDTAEALADYRAVAAGSPGFKRVQHWITELAPPAAVPLKVEPARPLRAASGAEVTPLRASAPPSSIPPSRPSQGKTPWAVLGVGQGATQSQILFAYLALSRKYHPDIVASLGEEYRAAAENEMRAINRAWAQLTRGALVS